MAIEMYEGEDKVLSFTIYDSNKQLKDLTNATAIFVMSKMEINSNTITDTITKTTSSGINIGENTVNVIIDRNADVLRKGTWNYELRVTDKNSISEVVSIGSIVIKRSITNM